MSDDTESLSDMLEKMFTSTTKDVLKTLEIDIGDEFDIKVKVSFFRKVKNDV